MSETPLHSETVEEPEYYVEPAEMRSKDIAGVVLALLALSVIGLSGYVWLNPELGWQDVGRTIGLGHKSAQQAGSTQAESSATMTTGEETLTRTTPSMKSDSCPYCGMYTAPSESHIKVGWSNGSHSDHDCWDCAFGWGRQEGLTFNTVQVSRFGSGVDDPEWLDAHDAVYLYDVKLVKGSMPPYVAAFADRASAEAAQPEMGGEVLDWDGLQAHFREGK